MSGACPRCDGEIGCVECHPQTLKLRAEGRRLRKKVEELEGQEPPAPELPPDLEELQKENQALRAKLEASEKRWRDAHRAADNLQEVTRAAYLEVVAAAKASKLNCVFQLGVTVDDFLKEWFP